MKFIIFLCAFMTSVYAAEFHSITEKNIKGETFPLSQFKGKTVLVVNVASQCGYTGQLDDLEALFNKYKNKNFVVLGVPTNDFGGQTPEDDKAMLEFCQKNYNVTFPILTKKTVQGKEKRELYKFLTEQSGKKFQGDIKWNFEKFLVDQNGQVVGRFESKVTPSDKELKSLIEKTLAKIPGA